ncbi:MAG: NAD(P)H-binding protein [Azospirillaceae bacterium]|nr:NAD(P)H-binding protein [Azospirillaceae bacterium]
MHVITGITGKVGDALAHALLASGHSVRAVVRDAAKGAPWAARGYDVAVAAMEDAGALGRAFTDAEAVFILLPPNFDPEPGYPATRRMIEAIAAALSATRPAKVVCLSTIGADAAEDNLLSQLTLLEQHLAMLDLPVTFLRAAWFMDNALWDVPAARDEGILRSFLQPLDRAIPMMAARDVGHVAARLMRQEWTGTRVVELAGPAPVSPTDLAAAFARALGRPVRAESVPRDTWAALFHAQGMANPGPRMRMLDGFNAGWIAFTGGHQRLRGDTTLADVIMALGLGAPSP